VLIILDKEDPVATAEGVTVPDHAWELRACFERVFSGKGRAIRRLGSAGTSVAFQLTGAQRGSVTVLLDRHPPCVTDGSEPAEILIELTTDQAEAFARGSLLLPTAILEGEIRFRGPVRKYLAVDPIIRALLSGEELAAHAG
jgi:hypothetical protein